MKKSVLILSLAIGNLVFATHLPNVLCKKTISKSHLGKTANLRITKPFSCSSSISTNSSTHANGTVTQTTTTTVTCDTPQELATFHKIMKSIGMGV